MELYNDLLVTELSYEMEFYCYQLKENDNRVVDRDVIKKNIT